MSLSEKLNVFCSTPSETQISRRQHINWHPREEASLKLEYSIIAFGHYAFSFLFLSLDNLQKERETESKN